MLELNIILVETKLSDDSGDLLVKAEINIDDSDLFNLLKKIQATQDAILAVVESKSTSANENLPDDYILRLKDVQVLTGLSRSTIYAQISKREFPVQIRLGEKAVGWWKSDVLRWIEGRKS